MSPTKDKNPRPFQPHRLDIIVPEGALLDPIPGTAFTIRQGRFSIIQEITTSDGYREINLGSIERGGTVYEGNLFQDHVPLNSNVYYRAACPCVVLPFTFRSLPTTQKELTEVLLGFVQNKSRQVERIISLASDALQRAYELEHAARPAQLAQQTHEAELAHLRKELQAARKSAVEARKKHAAELQAQAEKLRAEAEQQRRAEKEEHLTVLNSLKKASHILAEMYVSQEQLSNGVLHVVNQALLASGKPSISPEELMGLITKTLQVESPPHTPVPEPFDEPVVSRNPTLIPANFGMHPSEMDADPKTKRWGKS